MNLASLVLAAVLLEPAVTGLQTPVSIAHAGDSRLFIVQQNGLIRVWQPPQLLQTPFLDVRSLVSTGNERGLLGLAFHPRYSENGRFFINYTDTNGNTVIAQYIRSSADPNRADPSPVRIILRVNQPFPNHNGGQLQFGPDGYLYIGLGDGGSGGDPGNRAQNPAELLGKILRIDVDSGDPYAIPPSNPFVNRSGFRPEIWALGLRNPWRFSFDRSYGDLWIADVGQGDFEEIDFQPRASIGGENYGWRRMEGTHCFNPSTNCTDGTLVQPVIEYDHGGGACSVTGGYVYRGTRNWRLYGTYLYADFCNGVIQGAVDDGTGRFVSTRLFDAPFQVSTFGEDVNGEIYVADYSGGALYRIVENSEKPPKRRSVRR
jgi:glucose/arabinose dehydrogenase